MENYSNFSNNNRFVKDFKFIKNLGNKLKYCLVKYDLTGFKYVIRSVDNNSETIKELKLMENIKHENIVNYFYSWNDCKENRILTAMEFCSCGNLNEWISSDNYSSDKKILTDIMQNITKGLIYLHNKKLVHFNLNMKNIYINDRNVAKIGGLYLLETLNNIIRVNGNINLRSNVNKELNNIYQSPEQKNGEECNEKVDIYSAGIIFFKLLHPKFTSYPLNLDNNDEQKQLFLSPEYEFYAEMCLIKECIKQNPTDRIASKNFHYLLNNIPNPPQTFANAEKLLSTITPFPTDEQKDHRFNHLLSDNIMQMCNNWSNGFKSEVTAEELSVAMEVLKNPNMDQYMVEVPKLFDQLWEVIKDIYPPK